MPALMTRLEEPILIDWGDRLVSEGTGLPTTVKGIELLSPPPGAGLVTVTL